MDVENYEAVLRRIGKGLETDALVESVLSVHGSLLHSDIASKLQILGFHNEDSGSDCQGLDFAIKRLESKERVFCENIAYLDIPIYDVCAGVRNVWCSFLEGRFDFPQ